uniref:Uncharacterized protein n=1 Tax=Anopheles christyi TaxID=43041 RepID=A0A182K918_9DIPT
MPLQPIQKLLAVVLTVSIVSVAALPATPPSTTEQEPETELSLQYASTERAFGAVGKCSETSTLLYVETVIVVKDDSTNLVNGTIEISIGSPVTIECVRIVAKTEHDRMALQGYRFVGPTTIEVTVAELLPSQSNSLEYSVYVYGSVGSKKTTTPWFEALNFRGKPKPT